VLLLCQGGARFQCVEDRARSRTAAAEKSPWAAALPAGTARAASEARARTAARAA